MQNISKIVVGLMLVLMAGVANASPLVTVSVLGRRTGTVDPFTSVVNLQLGDTTVDYQLVVQMAAIGTTNVQGTTTRTITSLTVGTDGMNGTKHDITQSSSPTGLQMSLNQALTLVNGWADGTGASGGTPTIRSGTDDDLLAVRPVHSAGVFTGVAQQIIGSATMAIGAFGDSGSATIRARWFQTGGASVKINGSTTILPSNTTENGLDPVIGYGALIINVPEPTSVGMLALGLVGFAARRRRIA